jgi:hypothetical protein
MDEHGRVTVQVAGQWTHEDQEQIAHALGLPHDQVRVIYPAIGGAFGGREDMTVQIILALAAWRLAQRGVSRPVKIIWSRAESMLAHHKRHQMFFKTRWGATKDGRLVAAEVEAISDAGAYAYTSTKVLGNTTLMCTGPYEIPNVKVDTYAVYTNNIPGGAFRGFGGPQGEHIVVVENTPTVHNVVVCTLCSCYPWPVLGLPPAWYKDPAYRSRVVREPRQVLREMGLELGPEVEIRVWDSSSEVRYMVLPERPPGTENLDIEALQRLVTRDAMIGVARVTPPGVG